MPRLLTLCLVLLAATPALASADECMLSTIGRGEISGISVGDPLIAVFGYESVDVALELQLGLRQLPSGTNVLGAGQQGGMLWCLSPDDPRCFPVEGPTETPTPADPMPSTSAQTTPSVASHCPANRLAILACVAGPAGVATRVERPPRS